jgi:hypothetical protein
MKRLVILCLFLGFAGMVNVGCEKSKTMERKETVTTPGGSTTTTDTHKVESSGDKAPANAAGEKATK